ncbi:MAG: hypothetical protein HY288_11660 [Planctomycetia bacterium]|nr:hypothetical protein [Planctomycetia bacterium]
MRKVLLLAVLLAGCGKAAAPKTKVVVPIDQVPPAVMNAAQTKKPDVKFNKAMKIADGIYEVQGKTKSGKIVEVEVSEAGEVLLVE